MNKVYRQKIPKISIVTPSYNSAKYIEDCIQSVLNQNYPNFEHIVIDGGSTDGTVDILKKYPHLKWISEPDEGQSDALNKGFRMATGDVVGWLNADDYYLDDVFYKVAKIFEKKDAYTAVYSNFYVQKLPDVKLYKKFAHPPLKFLALFHCYIPSTTFFFRREILEKEIKIDKNLHIAMDKDFFANILHNGYKVKYVNDFFAVFRWHDENKSLNTPTTKKTLIEEGFRIYNRYASFKLPENRWGIKLYSMSSHSLLLLRKFIKLYPVIIDKVKGNQ